MAGGEAPLQLDLYGLLGVGEKASEKEVKKAYRQKALTCHPDKNPDDPRAAEVFHRLSQALAVLTDAAARAAYDKVREAKKKAAERTEKLDEKRKKVKLDLEAREREAQARESEEEEISITRTLEQEIIRLREEGSRQLQEQQRLIQEQIRLEREQHVQGGEQTGLEPSAKLCARGTPTLPQTELTHSSARREHGGGHARAPERRRSRSLRRHHRDHQRHQNDSSRSRRRRQRRASDAAHDTG